ncbi:MAG: HAD hydrolase-like protein [Verrucomicrobia bacterium]|nr:HAD hydrolase-like protein [Verrucomicrobiota bacterium]
MELLFDLDGTLTNPAAGITRSLEHALVTLGHGVSPGDDLKRFIGPPLREAFAELLSTDDEATLSLAIRHYRDRYTEAGIYENDLYPDVPSGLASLRELGHRLWIATSKPQVYAQRIAEHFGISRWFENVYGSELSGRNADKAELIGHLLKTEKLRPTDAWMIGDRIHDVVGAQRNGVRTIAVLWGYGSEAELRAARPDAMVRSMAELCREIRGRH